MARPRRIPTIFSYCNGSQQECSISTLNDDEAQFKDLKPEWVQAENDTPDIRKHKLARELAHTLWVMVDRLEGFNRLSRAEHDSRHKKVLASFKEEIENIELPDVEYPPARDLAIHPLITAPKLIFQGESRMETYNRCWCLLKYFQYCRSSKGMWPTKFSHIALLKSVMVDGSHVPHWLRPPQHIKRPDAIIKTADIAVADALPKITIKVLWLKDQKFHGKDELDDALAAAEENSVEIPNTLQNILQDPRISPSLGSFKDSIRRQYNCEQIRMNIRTLTLQYRSSALEGTQSMNILRADWDAGTKSTFQDAANTEFQVRVTFQALDNENDGIYESFEPPPAVSALFDTTSGDVKSKPEAIREILNAAFGVESQKVPAAPDDSMPGELKAGGMPALLGPGIRLWG